MGWSMDRQGIRTLFDHECKRLKQIDLSGPRGERVSLDTYEDELAAREVAFHQEAEIRQMVRTRITASEIREQHNHVASRERGLRQRCALPAV